jgi:hypothetical protein
MSLSLILAHFSVNFTSSCWEVGRDGTHMSGRVGTRGTHVSCGGVGGIHMSCGGAVIVVKVLDPPKRLTTI